MNFKRKYLCIALLISMIITFPAIALAKTDQYGYDAQKRMFIGTLDNWEAFLEDSPPTSFDWNQTDTVFIERQWDKRFDPMIEGKPPSAPGAWQKVRLWEYLSGDQLGWTWHEEMTIVYSPNKAIPGAIALTPEEILFTGFYVVNDKEWLAGPNGEITIEQNLSVKREVFKKVLKFLRNKSHS